jgi:O-antigen/teichoic acid export membrane protein
VAYRFALAVEIIMAGVDMALMPLIYAKYREEGTRAELAKLLRRLLLFGALIILLLAALARDLLEIFATAQYRDAADLVPILAAGVFLSRLYIIAPGLWIAKRTMVIAGINVVIAVLNLVLNLVLIPHFDVYGAATATLTSAGVGFAIYMVFSQVHYRVDHGWLRPAACLLLVTAGVFAAQRLGTMWPPLAAAGIGVKVLVAVGLSGLCAGFLLTGEEWRKFLRLGR